MRVRTSMSTPWDIHGRRDRYPCAERPGFTKPPNDVLHGIAIEGSIQLLRHIANMRGREHVGQFAQRVRIFERFDIVHVQCGAGNLTGRESPKQRGIVDDRTPATY